MFIPWGGPSVACPTAMAFPGLPVAGPGPVPGPPPPPGPVPGPPPPPGPVPGPPPPPGPVPGPPPAVGPGPGPTSSARASPDSSAGARPDASARPAFSARARSRCGTADEAKSRKVSGTARLRWHVPAVRGANPVHPISVFDLFGMLDQLALGRHRRRIKQGRSSQDQNGRRHSRHTHTLTTRHDLLLLSQYPAPFSAPTIQSNEALVCSKLIRICGIPNW